MFVHRIHVSKIVYVGEVIELPRKSTKQESVNEQWRNRWTWSISAKNLTPEYGHYWKRCAERTSNLARQFNENNPHDTVNIRRLNYGSHVKIPLRFAEFLLREIIGLEVNKCMREDSFRSWLMTRRGSGTAASRLSNCRVVEKWEGDLDEHLRQDKLRGLLDPLTYTKEDERSNSPARHKIPIDGNVYNGTATYKAAVSLYKQFREETARVNPSVVVATSHTTTQLPSVRAPQPALGSSPATNQTVSVSQLADWRRKLIKCLVEMENNASLNAVASVAERISRFERSGMIPQEIAAMMRAITEMRNAADTKVRHYQSLRVELYGQLGRLCRNGLPE